MVSVDDRTDVTAGAGLSGGGTQDDVTLSIPTGGVVSSMVADESLSASDLGPAAVGTSEIADGAVSNADLDECHGHTHAVTWRGKKTRSYHYHATAEYPYTLGCYRGTPAPSG